MKNEKYYEPFNEEQRHIAEAWRLLAVIAAIFIVIALVGGATVAYMWHWEA